jgi:hypothetical protein
MKKTALNALTIIPARYVKADDKLGTLEKGKQACFIITTGNIFDKETQLLENWVLGSRFVIGAEPPYFLGFNYNLFIDSRPETEIKIGFKKDKKINIMPVPSNSTNKIDRIIYSAENQSISFCLKTDKDTFLLSGWKEGDNLWGTGTNRLGQTVKWEGRETESADSANTNDPKKIKSVTCLHGWLALCVCKKREQYVFGAQRNRLDQ